MECPEYSCVSTKPPPPFGIKIESQKQCPKEICPPGYKVILEKMNLYYPDACPRYRCKPPPPTEAVCNVTGRTFNTFDNLEYKYDICNHLLARELAANKWYITREYRFREYSKFIKMLKLIRLTALVFTFQSRNGVTSSVTCAKKFCSFISMVTSCTCIPICTLISTNSHTHLIK